jgi:ribosomal protein S15P/S13E
MLHMLCLTAFFALLEHFDYSTFRTGQHPEDIRRLSRRIQQLRPIYRERRRLLMQYYRSMNIDLSLTALEEKSFRI